jgi:hypothetical protein
MIDVREMNAQGVRVREALAILQGGITEPPLSLEVQYLRAVVSNLLLMLEKDAGVAPSYFGSMGIKMLELNPFDGQLMPPAVSNEAPPLFFPPSREPLNPPAPTPDP